MLRALATASIALGIALLGSSDPIRADEKKPNRADEKKPNRTDEKKPKSLFSMVDSKKAELTPKQSRVLSKMKSEKTAVEVQLVKIATGAFAEANIAFNVGAKTSMYARRTRFVKLKSGARSWLGTIAREEPYGRQTARFFIKENNTIGSFASGKYIYNVRPLGNGLHVLIKRDPRRIPADHPEKFKEVEKRARDKKPPKPANKNNRREKKPKAGNSTTGTAKKTGSIVQVTVLVVFTNKVSENHPDVTLFVESLIDGNVNATFKQCGIPVRLRLVETRELKYVESGDLAKDVDRLRINGDNVMDQVHSIRNIKGADIVVLLVDKGDAAGYAADIKASADTAFAAVDDEYADWYFTFAHEIGHLFGARHDPAADASTTPFAYGHGYRNPKRRWRTIMAYDCDDLCDRLGIWSSPLSKHGGQSAGTAAQHDNSRVLKETASNVAGFRP